MKLIFSLIPDVNKRALPAVALVLLIFCAFTQCLFVSACTSRREMAEYLTESGKEKTGKLDQKGAKNDFNLAIMLDPEYAEAYHNRGKVEMALKEYAAAEGDFKAASVLYKVPKDKAEAILGEVQAQRIQGKRKEALATVNRAVKMAPKHRFCYLLRGTIRSDMGDYQGAIKDFDYDSNFSVVSEALLAMSRYGEAKRNLEKVLSKFKELPPIEQVLLLGYAYWGLDDIKIALKQFNKAKNKYPEDPEPLVALAKIKLNEFDLKSARGLFNKAVWTKKYIVDYETYQTMPEAYLGRCVVEYLQDDLSTAFDDCVRARIEYGVFPGSGHAMLFTWVVQLKQGKSDWASGAVKDFIEAANPVEWRLPALRFAAGKTDEKEFLREVKKIKFGGNKRLCEAYFFLASAKLAEDEKSAKSYFKKAVKACPPYSLERLAANYELDRIK